MTVSDQCSLVDEQFEAIREIWCDVAETLG